MSGDNFKINGKGISEYSGDPANKKIYVPDAIYNTVFSADSNNFGTTNNNNVLGNQITMTTGYKVKDDVNDEYIDIGRYYEQYYYSAYINTSLENINWPANMNKATFIARGAGGGPGGNVNTSSKQFKMLAKRYGVITNSSFNIRNGFTVVRTPYSGYYENYDYTLALQSSQASFIISKNNQGTGGSGGITHGIINKNSNSNKLQVRCGARGNAGSNDNSNFGNTTTVKWDGENKNINTAAGGNSFIAANINVSADGHLYTNQATNTNESFHYFNIQARNAATGNSGGETRIHDIHSNGQTNYVVGGGGGGDGGSIGTSDNGTLRMRIKQNRSGDEGNTVSFGLYTSNTAGDIKNVATNNSMGYWTMNTGNTGNDDNKNLNDSDITNTQGIILNDRQGAYANGVVHIWFTPN